MEANQYHQDRINLFSASTFAAQANNSIGQSKFLFRTPVSHTEEPETPNFSQQMGRRKFPHASISFEEETTPLGAPLLSSLHLITVRVYLMKRRLEGKEKQAAHSCGVPCLNIRFPG